LYKIQPKTLFVGKSLKYLPTCHSTNDYCAQLLENEDITNGFCLYTGHQTNGRGQRGNVWESAAGQNIMMSIVLKPTFINATDQFHLNMAVSIGIYKALSTYLPEYLTIKWPNDIYYKTLKIGGILIENSIMGNKLTSSIIGIGLNINQLCFENKNASSLKRILLNDVDFEINKILESIFENIETYYLKIQNNDIDHLKREYLQNLFRYNKWHYFKKNDLAFEGKIIGVDKFGRLEVETEFGLETFGFKEVEFVI
jgi:BirA family transcriptional regulator, biotin operon repressor / biotin---[acetyl-CoA-carboxylase] ligase